MRIRSALAAVALGAALTAAGAAGAAAGEEPQHDRGGDHHAVCSPYFGVVHAETAGILYGGADCRVGHF
ncbi:hypothetical protein ACH4ZX_09200 [Streptomyces sp. NPDC020490]|uniref:hypothetical protein n=1 Tax=Streptomyces sp. NPDC020490 TaxID=3365078 RepID=UPI0037A4116E